MSPLPNDARRALLELARQAIAQAVCHQRIMDAPHIPGWPQDAVLQECSGAFVTLHARGRLRGCIGQMDGTRSLSGTVITCAIGAALHDPRFTPVTPQELPALEIEISVLSAPVPVCAQDVEAGRHGVMVVRGSGQGAPRGVLLPQVAVEHGWTAQRLLEETCRKAGLPLDAWRDPQTQILAFTAEVFSVKDVSSQPAAHAHQPAG
ncbi:MAG TPA: AmmeMemoRadiSam system protein A [Candidatus Acidoferrales bacterium]